MNPQKNNPPEGTYRPQTKSTTWQRAAGYGLRVTGYGLQIQARQVKIKKVALKRDYGPTRVLLESRIFVKG
jgi:hypothetical protein